MQTFIIKNKRASIPVTVLVILTIALCIFALVSFSLASSKRSAEIKDFELLEKAYAARAAVDAGYSAPVQLTSVFSKIELPALPARNFIAEKTQLKPGFFNWIWTREKILQYRFTYAPQP
jgi:hypothetical protein